ncbi:hypothetical protein G7074_18085 [Pedobacter sp. HDW13]|uniref:hypothetical protein n=1 Tax=Pedobacter sp. HDW13 TaxID=2714940 RepID=UPI00140817FF|nr:hypothetical protein [Pedobacter sp. HDW13]QIL41005.1 hypothetical protein G7074_18085 [Pedobacter sp. HDW13]
MEFSSEKLYNNTVVRGYYDGRHVGLFVVWPYQNKYFVASGYRGEEREFTDYDEAYAYITQSISARVYNHLKSVINSKIDWMIEGANIRLTRRIQGLENKFTKDLKALENGAMGNILRK